MITQDYTTQIIGENTEVTMMSPYGGTIYVDIDGDTDCEVSIEGAIDMPYFIQGTIIFLRGPLYYKGYFYILFHCRSNNK